MRPGHWKEGDVSVLDNVTEVGRRVLVAYLKDFYFDMTEGVVRTEEDIVLQLDFLLEALGAEGHGG